MDGAALQNHSQTLFLLVKTAKAVCESLQLLSFVANVQLHKAHFTADVVRLSVDLKSFDIDIPSFHM